MAFGSLGDAWIDIHGNTDPFKRDIDKGLSGGLEQASRDADQILRSVGQDFGKKISHSAETELGKHGHELAHAVESATTNVPFDFKGSPRRFNRDRLGRFAKTMVTDLENEVEKVFSGSDSKGFFGRIGDLFSTGIQDAIGSIGGTPSGSPIALVTGPAIAALVALIIGAIQAVTGLLGVLALVPAALAAIGLQAGALFLVFHGLTTAISGAFSAKTFKEAQDAVKGLTPEAQKFVLSLLPLRDIFKSIQAVAQSNFFTALGTTVTLVAQTLGPLLRGGFGELARSLGWFFNQLGHFFASPVFINFVSLLFPATARWIGQFGPVFIRILDSITRLATTTLPYLSAFGDFLVNNFGLVADIFEKLSKDENFKRFLHDALSTLGAVFELVGQAVKFVLALLVSLDKAGGQLVINQISESLSRLTALISSPLGQKALEALVNLSVLLLQLFTGLIAAIIVILGGLESLGEQIEHFWHWLTGTGKKAGQDLKNTANTISDAFTGIPNRILAVFSNFGSLLYNAGRNLLHGLIEGIQSMIKPLTDKLSFITSLIPAWKGPEDKDRKLLEPAGRAVMEGFGAGIKRGAASVKDMLADYTNTLGGLQLSGSTGGINFGPGAIRITFAGTVPTDAQATSVGRAVGNGINDRLAQRDTALAIRTL